MRRAFKFRLRPTVKQAQTLTVILDDHRELYNAALQERREAWRKRAVTVTYGMESAQLKHIRKLVTERARWSFSSQQATLRRLNLAMQAFFLTTAQRAHSLRYPKHAPRSNRKTRSAMKVAKTHRTVARRRRDFHHKSALGLVRRFDLLAHEQLHIAGMTRAPRPKPDPDQPGSFLPNRAAAKAGLNKSILDAAWRQFLTILAAKAENAGRLRVAVNARNSSRTCHQCRHVDPASRNGTMFRCTHCGHANHADINAARNHLRAGLALAQGNHPGGSPRL